MKEITDRISAGEFATVIGILAALLVGVVVLLPLLMVLVGKVIDYWMRVLG